MTWKFWLLIMLAITPAAVGASAIGPYLASVLGVREEWCLAPGFFGILAAEAWIYGQYKKWRFLRSGKL